MIRVIAHLMKLVICILKAMFCSSSSFSILPLLFFSEHSLTSDTFSSFLSLCGSSLCHGRLEAAGGDVSFILV